MGGLASGERDLEHGKCIPECHTIAWLADEFDRLDIAIANAGISAAPGFGPGPGRLAAVEDATCDRVLAVDLSGVFATVQAAAGVMAPGRRGSIIAVASVAGLKAEPMVGCAYAATKAGVVNLLRKAAVERAPQGTRVNGIAPGPIRTNIACGRVRDPQAEAGFLAATPTSRIGDPEGIKGLALLLAPDASSFITGATIPLVGGIMATRAASVADHQLARHAALAHQPVGLGKAVGAQPVERPRPRRDESPGIEERGDARQDLALPRHLGGAEHRAGEMYSRMNPALFWKSGIRSIGRVAPTIEAMMP